VSAPRSSEGEKIPPAKPPPRLRLVASSLVTSSINSRLSGSSPDSAALVVPYPTPSTCGVTRAISPTPRPASAGRAQLGARSCCMSEATRPVPRISANATSAPAMPASAKAGSSQYEAISTRGTVKAGDSP